MPLCSVSTSWRSDKIANARALVEAVKETGVSALELEFRMAPETFAEIKKHRSKWGIEISSLHAICPAPPGKGSGAERFAISELDEEKRKIGVQDILATMQNASEIGARATVVHCGYVDMERDANYAMMRHYDSGGISGAVAQETLREVMLSRTRQSKRNFGQALKSLDEINREAVRLGMSVGIENRYYLNEFPIFEELGIIFNMFDGGRLGYWHDVGHAHTMETLHGIPQEKMLETFSDNLVGMHLHDVINGYTDHNEPGCGAVDFDMVKRYVKDDTILVMELNHRVSPENARRGVAFLREKGIFPPA